MGDVGNDALDGGAQIAGRNGFGEEAIHAGLQAEVAVIVEGMCGESKDGDVVAGGRFEGANHARGLEPIHNRHAQVHQHEIESVLLKEVQGFLAIRGEGNRVAHFSR